jgi:hypothetical protein
MQMNNHVIHVSSPSTLECAAILVVAQYLALAMWYLDSSLGT